ncbi:hypothetical protein B566_EDAN012780 [Ephemera danica]|nr:hypothetical protein B566_EDAN012780 [Ephemera danica]
MCDPYSMAGGRTGGASGGGRGAHERGLTGARLDGNDSRTLRHRAPTRHPANFIAIFLEMAHATSSKTFTSQTADIKPSRKIFDKQRLLHLQCILSGHLVTMSGTNVLIHGHQRHLAVDELVNSVHAAYPLDEERLSLDWEMVHDAGCTRDDGQDLPHHVSSPEEVRALADTSLAAILAALPGPPTVITVARLHLVYVQYAHTKQHANIYVIKILPAFSRRDCHLLMQADPDIFGENITVFPHRRICPLVEVGVAAMLGRYRELQLRQLQLPRMRNTPPLEGGTSNHALKRQPQ